MTEEYIITVSGKRSLAPGETKDVLLGQGTSDERLMTALNELRRHDTADLKVEARLVSVDGHSVCPKCSRPIDHLISLHTTMETVASRLEAEGLEYVIGSDVHWESEEQGVYRCPHGDCAEELFLSRDEAVKFLKGEEM